MSTLDDDFVEFYGYDQSWRLTTVWRQGAKQTSGPLSGQRPQPVIYERFLHNPGWGSRLDAPLMSQVNDHWDDLDENGGPIAPIWQGEGAHVRTFIQDSFGNVIAVRDNTLQRDTVRISYSPTGEPILDSDYSGADFNRNGGVDGADLADFTAAYEQGDETADLDQNGGIDGVDLALFFDWYEAGFMGDHTLNDQRFLYRGYAWDDTLKMYHVRHRVYDPARMLWIQRDPLGRIPGSNEYAYCLGEPVDLFDPMGLLSLPGHRPQMPDLDFTPETEYMDPEDNEEAHLALQLAGYIPGVGIEADLADASLYIAERNYVEAAVNLIGTIAGYGDAFEIGYLALESAGIINDDLVQTINYYIQEAVEGVHPVLYSPLGKKAKKEIDWLRGKHGGGGKGGKGDKDGGGRRGGGGDNRSATSCDGSTKEADGRSRTPINDPNRPRYERGHPGKPVVDHIRARAAGGHPTDPANLHVKPWEWNARKGAYEGQLLHDRRRLIDQGLTPDQADEVLANEWRWLQNDVLARPVDPDIIDTIPWTVAR